MNTSGWVLFPPSRGTYLPPETSLPSRGENGGGEDLGGAKWPRVRFCFFTYVVSDAHAESVRT